MRWIIDLFVQEPYRPNKLNPRSNGGVCPDRSVAGRIIDGLTDLVDLQEHTRSDTADRWSHVDGDQVSIEAEAERTRELQARLDARQIKVNLGYEVGSLEGDSICKVLGLDRLNNRE